jgi:hypothetical protein
LHGRIRNLKLEQEDIMALKAPRHFYGEQREAPRKTQSESFFFLFAVLPALVGLATYTFW